MITCSILRYLFIVGLHDCLLAGCNGKSCQWRHLWHILSFICWSAIDNHWVNWTSLGFRNNCVQLLHVRTLSFVTDECNSLIHYYKKFSKTSSHSIFLFHYLLVVLVAQSDARSSSVANSLINKAVERSYKDV